MFENFPSVSIIIPVRNRARLIAECLSSLIESVKNLNVDVEILVADDASTDETPAVVSGIAKKSPTPIKLLTSLQRGGPAHARNLAIKAARGELIIFVDSDEVVSEDFVRAHLAMHRKKGPMVYGLGKIISVPSLEAAKNHPKATIWDYSGATLDTANASVRREHLEAVGGFDPGFEGMGWHDLDLGYRLRRYGLEKVLIPTAVSYHIQPPLRSPEQLAARLQKERERGKTAVYFLERHPGLKTRLSTQDTKLHLFLNWISRAGGLINQKNVLKLAEWARRHRLRSLEQIWLSGVINKAYLEVKEKTQHERATAQKKG
ncbi:MAG: glycosyltransferase [Firmicutes bacterium]|nr:glycosyltransferase [Bacillota bacterium]